MLQFYFLSILLNLVTGLVLFCEKNEKPELAEDFLNEENFADEDFFENDSSKKSNNSNPILGLFESKNFKLVLGVLGVLVGIMKLLSVIQNDVPVIGDLFPAIMGIIGGFCVLLQFYMEMNSIDYAPNSLLQTIFVDNRRIIGICCLVVATLHFVFPKVLFL